MDERDETTRTGDETMTTAMPSRQQFAEASRTLESRGFQPVGSMMVDDAYKTEVINFGLKYLRADGKQFWLNYKTINALPF
jgi:hypothetical protein